MSDYYKPYILLILLIGVFGCESTRPLEKMDKPQEYKLIRKCYLVKWKTGTVALILPEELNKGKHLYSPTDKVGELNSGDLITVSHFSPGGTAVDRNFFTMLEDLGPVFIANIYFQKEYDVLKSLE